MWYASMVLHGDPVMVPLHVHLSVVVMGSYGVVYRTGACSVWYWGCHHRDAVHRDTM